MVYNLNIGVRLGFIVESMLERIAQEIHAPVFICAATCLDAILGTPQRVTPTFIMEDKAALVRGVTALESIEDCDVHTRGSYIWDVYLRGILRVHLRIVDDHMPKDFPIAGVVQFLSFSEVGYRKEFEEALTHRVVQIPELLSAAQSSYYRAIVDVLAMYNEVGGSDSPRKVLSGCRTNRHIVNTGPRPFTIKGWDNLIGSSASDVSPSQDTAPSVGYQGTTFWDAAQLPTESPAIATPSFATTTYSRNVESGERAISSSLQPSLDLYNLGGNIDITR